VVKNHPQSLRKNKQGGGEKKRRGTIKPTREGFVGSLEADAPNTGGGKSKVHRKRPGVFTEDLTQSKEPRDGEKMPNTWEGSNLGKEPCRGPVAKLGGGEFVRGRGTGGDKTKPKDDR